MPLAGLKRVRVCQLNVCQRRYRRPLSAFVIKHGSPCSHGLLNLDRGGCGPVPSSLYEIAVSVRSAQTDDAWRDRRSVQCSTPDIY